jgi:hypothetical protein
MREADMARNLVRERLLTPIGGGTRAEHPAELDVRERHAPGERQLKCAD